MSDLIELFLNLVIFLTLLTVGYVSGTILEKRHYKSILRREEEFRHMAVVPTELKVAVPDPKDHQRIQDMQLVTGICVLSDDYFKMIHASLKSIFGGTLTAYESLLDRTRREAILRMQEQAPWADMIVNVRIETSSIGGDGTGAKGEITAVEAIVSGTAIQFMKA